ncbi:MAG: SCO family protein [Variibacter sp.]
MSERTKRLRLIAAAFCAGLASVFLVMMFIANNTPSAVVPAAVGGPFKLTDQNGAAVTDTDLKGKPFLVFFGFTHCPDVCPTTLFEVSEVMRALGPKADGTRALFVTVDPERDTPKVMKDYLSSFDPHLIGLSGTPEAIEKMTKAYRVYSRKIPTKDGDYTMDHTALVYLMDKQGRFVAPFNLKRKPEEAAADLSRYL